MMGKPESLVPTMETCHRLKRAGFPQDTLLSWHHRFGVRFAAWHKGTLDIAAPTLAEVLDRLPSQHPDKMALLVLFKVGKAIAADYQAINGSVLYDNVPLDNGAEAAALLWLAVHEDPGQRGYHEGFVPSDEENRQYYATKKTPPMP